MDISSFEINTFGATQYEAIEMARDAIGAAGIDKIDHGETIPEPMSYKEAKVLGGDDFITVVDIDFDQYRSELDNRLVRKNLTLPYWMNVKAESLGLNFSLALREKDQPSDSSNFTNSNRFTITVYAHQCALSSLSSRFNRQSLFTLLSLRQEISQALLQVGGLGLVLHLFQLLVCQVQAGFVEQVGAGEIECHDGRQAVDLQLVRAGLLTARGN